MNLIKGEIKMDNIKGIENSLRSLHSKINVIYNLLLTERENIVDAGVTDTIKVKLHNSNKDTQILAELPWLDKLPKAKADEVTVALIANCETFTFIIDAYRNNDVISMYHEVLSDKEFKNMKIIRYEYESGLITIWFRYLS